MDNDTQYQERALFFGGIYAENAGCLNKTLGFIG
jgi:hypothetical protein